jgi:hypothetical protein
MAQLQILIDAYQPSKSVYVKFVVDNNDVAKRLMSIDKKLKPLSSSDGKGVQIIVPQQAIDKFLGGSLLPKILKMCQDNGYELPNMDEVKDDIIVASKSFVTPQMKSEATTKTNDLIESFFAEYSDPEVMKIINKLVHDIKIKADDDKLKYAVLSKKNRIMAYAQKNDATYIASQKTWRDVFHRRVLPTAKVIIINAGNNGDSYDSNFASNKLGMDRNQAYQNTHVRVSFDRLAKYGQTDPTAFYGVPYYDISDTVPYDGTDRFIDDAGLESNLTGALNQKALEQLPSDAIDSTAIENSPLKANHNNESMIYNNILAFASDKPQYKAVVIAASGKDPNDPNSAADIVEALFRVKFEREHNAELLKQKVKKCTAFVLGIYKAATTRMLAYMAQNNDVFNRKDLTEMYSQILDVVDIIDNTVKESVGGHAPTFKEFLDALHIDISTLNNNGDSQNDIRNDIQTEDKEKISESFRKLWNRMI